MALPFVSGRAIVDAAVGVRVGERHVDLLAPQQPRQDRVVAGICADQAMRAEDPDVIGPADRNFRRRHRGVVAARRLMRTVRKNRLNFAEFEPGEFNRQSEVGQHDREFAELKRERLPIPPGALGEPVVG